MDKAKPGDKCVFTGFMTVVPDIQSLTKPGERIVQNLKTDGVQPQNFSVGGITGLK